jgi:hypothetical protein
MGRGGLMPGVLHWFGLLLFWLGLRFGVVGFWARERIE